MISSWKTHRNRSTSEGFSRIIFTETPEKALHDAYGKVVDRFRGDSSVTILRLDIAKAAERFADGSIDCPGASTN
jgi:hypothetical protein